VPVRRRAIPGRYGSPTLSYRWPTELYTEPKKREETGFAVIKIFSVFVFLFVLLHCEKIGLSEREKSFLREHPTIVLGTGDSWEPYSITMEDGNVTGFDSDILSRINEMTGAHFVERTGIWSRMQKLAREKKIDGLAALTENEERRKYFLFSGQLHRRRNEPACKTGKSAAYRFE
jgi:ABC-type amino acid transport substrate-binding protein